MWCPPLVWMIQDRELPSISGLMFFLMRFAAHRNIHERIFTMSKHGPIVDGIVNRIFALWPETDWYQEQEEFRRRRRAEEEDARNRKASWKPSTHSSSGSWCCTECGGGH